MRIKRRFLRLISKRFGMKMLMVATLLFFGVGAVLMSNLAKANAGGIFKVEVTPVTSPILSGDIANYKVSYSCSANSETGANSCDGVSVRVNMPVGASSKSIISDGSQIVSRSWTNNDGVWQFIPSIPAGSSGELYISWNTKIYTTPNGTALTAKAVASVGGVEIASGSGAVVVNATANWNISKTPSSTRVIVMDRDYTYVFGTSNGLGGGARGSLNLQNFVMTDTLPAGATFVSATMGGTYDAATNKVTWVVEGEELGGYDGPLGSGGAYKVTVKYEAAKGFVDGQTVTNQVDYTANPLGDPATNLTKSASVTNKLIATPPAVTASTSKSSDGRSISERPAGSLNHSWIMNVGNSSALPVSGTVKEAIPCADDVAATTYASGQMTDDCSTPATILKYISLSHYYSSVTTAIRWRTNTGQTGAYSTAISTSKTLYLADLGVPAGQKVTSLEFDYIAEVGAGSGSVSYTLQSSVDPSLNVGDVVTNTATNSFTDGLTSGTGSATAKLVIREMLPNVSTSTADAAGGNIAYLPGGQITWSSVYINSWFSNEGTSVTPDWYFVIPKGLRFIPGSIEYTNLTDIGGVQPELVEAKPGQNNLAGYTILHLRWPASAKMSISSSDTTAKRINIKFKTMVEPGQPAGAYSVSPPTMGQPATSQSRGIYTQARALGFINSYALHSFSYPDSYDINSDGSTAENAYGHSNSWTVTLSAVAFGDTLTKGSADGSFMMSGTALPAGDATYKLQLLNASNDGSKLKDLVFYQTLPRVGDGYVSSEISGSGARGSEYDVFLRGPISVPAGMSVKYSTANNPCRPEVLVANLGCDDTWSTTVADWSQVRAIRYFMAGEYTQGTGETVEVPVKTASTATDGQKAYTSMAYRATNATSGMFLSASEAPRVSLVIHSPKLESSKTTSPATGSQVLPNQEVTYTLKAKNTGTATLDTANISDNLANVLNNADLVAGSVAISSTNASAVLTAPSVANNKLTWSGSLQVGEEVTISYKVKVKTTANTANLDNGLVVGGRTSTGVDIASNCQTGVEAGCRTTHSTPSLSLVANKTASPATTSKVAPGDTIDYTLTLKNDGSITTSGSLSDDLANVLTSADFQNDSLQIASSVEGNSPTLPALNGDKLTWSGQLLSGETITVNYKVKVKNSAFSANLSNKLMADGTINGANFSSNCVTGTENGCSTTHSTNAPNYSLSSSKTASPATASELNRGDELAYVLRLGNQSQVTVDGNIVDDLSEVEQYANLVGDSLKITSSTGETKTLPTIASGKLTWSGKLAVGEEIQVTYKYKVKADAFAVAFKNKFSASAKDGSTNITAPCATGNEVNCFSQHSTDAAAKKLVARIKQSVSDGAQLKEGDLINYVIELENQSEVSLSNVNLKNIVTALLEAGEIEASSLKIVSSSGAKLDMPVLKDGQLTWRGNMPVGEKVTINYSLKISKITKSVTLNSPITAEADGQSAKILSNCVSGSETGCQVSAQVKYVPPATEPTKKTILSETGSNFLGLVGAFVAVILTGLIFVQRRGKGLIQ